MAISPILNSGMIQRADDIGSVKLQQDSKPMVEQQNAQVQDVKKTEEMRHQVNNSDDANKPDTHADAREKGKNSYFFRKKANVKKEGEKSEDRVVKKNMSGGFDMKV